MGDDAIKLGWCGRFEVSLELRGLRFASDCKPHRPTEGCELQLKGKP